MRSSRARDTDLLITKLTNKFEVIMEISSRIIHSLKFLDQPLHSKAVPTYLILLNRKIKKELFRFMHSRCTDLICTDGGANHLYEAFKEEDLARYTPHTVIGDFDSIKDDVKEFYRN